MQAVMDIVVEPGSDGIEVPVMSATTPTSTTTTLYDLLAALQEAAPAEDDDLVVTAMVHLLRSGRLAFLNKQITLDDYDLALS
jgi:hypothetical protein